MELKVAPLQVQLVQQVRYRAQNRGAACLGQLQVERRLVGAQYVLHAVANQTPVDGLGQKVGGAGVKGLLNGGQVVHAGDHENGQPLASLGAQVGAHLVPGQAGHVDVEHHHVKTLRAEQAQGVCTVAGQTDLVTGLAQGCAHEQARRVVVIGDQYVGSIKNVGGHVCAL